MPKFTIEVNESQQWTYIYEVEAKSSEEALHIAESKHFAGEQSTDNWLDDSTTEKIFIKETENA